MTAIPYDNLISRTDAEATIPEEIATRIITKTTEQSAVLQLFRRLPALSRKVSRIPVLSALPIAYWVTGDTGLKQTTEVNWANKFLTVEEIACIVPVPQNVIDDSEINITEEIEPLIAEAIGRTLDAAVFFGTNAPSSFPTNVNSAIVAASNDVAEAAAAEDGGFMADVDNLIAEVENDGYDVSGYVAARSARGKFRSARNAQGDRLDRERLSGDLKMLDGEPIAYPMRGLFPATVRMFAGDWESQFIVGVRKDITIDLATEAVIQDNTGAIMYNLFQQDMIALRATFRAGWQVANIINYDNATEATRYPASVLTF